jgi:hypothetical protein
VEYQNEIHTKLVAVMGDRLTVHLKSLNAISWDLPPAKPGVNEYMELLVKETVTAQSSVTLPRQRGHKSTELWHHAADEAVPVMYM